jgi:curved DNA-binding protein CbpA
MAIDHYAILGLEYGATRDEIKKAHRMLALRCLPLPACL